MREIYICFLLLLICLTACNQKNNSKTVVKDTVALAPLTITTDSTLHHTIYEFVEAYEKKSNSKINRLIHPDLGLVVIYRPGVADVYSRIDSFSFENPMPNYMGYESVKNTFGLTFDNLPEFDCGKEKWNREGFICDTINTPNQVSQIIEFENEFQPNKYSVSFIEKITDFEKDSYRVIVTGLSPLIFHVKQYKGGWYITVLDRAYAGCDA